jgi:hypothetical protein
MSRIKRRLSAAFVLLSLEFLNRVFWSIAQPIPVLLQTSSYESYGAARINISPTTAADLVLKIYGEPTPPAAGFFSANRKAGTSPRSVRVVPHSFNVMFAPKVSRYVSKTVLNI